MVAARRINADATAATLEGIVAGRGTAPGYIRCDNGPELTANALRDWCRFSGTGSSYIEPGAPWENPFVESFNGRLRDEFLAVEQFDSLLEAQVLIEDWRIEYHEAPAQQPGLARPESVVGAGMGTWTLVGGRASSRGGDLPLGGARATTTDQRKEPRCRTTPSPSAARRRPTMPRPRRWPRRSAGTTVTGGDGVAVHAVALDAESLPAPGSAAGVGGGLEAHRPVARRPAHAGRDVDPPAHGARLLARTGDERPRSAAHCQGWGDGGRSAVPCRLLARALPYDWGSDVPADAVGARLIQGLAQRHCVTACPAYDAPTGVAGMRDLGDIADWGGNQHGVKQRMQSNNTRDQVKRATSLAIKQLDDHPAGAMWAIAAVNHWGVAYGSKTLTFMRPSDYAILDSWIRGALVHVVPRIRDGNASSVVKGYVSYLDCCQAPPTKVGPYPISPT